MYKALIIGCGNIGAGYDFKNDQILTYAKALNNNNNFSFCIFDIDKEKAKIVSEKYNCLLLDEISVNSFSEFDCVIICTPTQTHFEYLIKAIDEKVRVIVCEKPISYKYSDLELLKDLHNKYSGKILVNYTRRFQPLFKKLKEDIKKILLQEKLTNISVRYQRGFLNNCSHAFDTIEYLMDEEIELTQIIKHNSIADHFEYDPTISLMAYWNDINVSVFGLSNVFFSHFEIDLYFKYHKIIIKESGQIIEIFKSEKESEFLNPLIKLCSYFDCIKNHMIYVIDEIEGLLESKLLHDNFIESLKLNQRMLNILQN